MWEAKRDRTGEFRRGLRDRDSLSWAVRLDSAKRDTARELHVLASVLGFGYRAPSWATPSPTALLFFPPLLLPVLSVTRCWTAKPDQSDHRLWSFSKCPAKTKKLQDWSMLLFLHLHCLVSASSCLCVDPVLSYTKPETKITFPMHYLLHFTFGVPVHYMRTNPFLGDLLVLLGPEDQIKALLVQLCFELLGLAVPI